MKEQMIEPTDKWLYLDAYFGAAADSGRWTTQDIIDNLSDTVDLTKETVNRYMQEHGYLPVRVDERLVWVKSE